MILVSRDPLRRNLPQRLIQYLRRESSATRESQGSKSSSDLTL